MLYPICNMEVKTECFRRNIKISWMHWKYVPSEVHGKTEIRSRINECLWINSVDQLLEKREMIRRTKASVWICVWKNGSKDKKMWKFIYIPPLLFLQITQGSEHSTHLPLLVFSTTTTTQYKLDLAYFLYSRPNFLCFAISYFFSALCIMLLALKEIKAYIYMNIRVNNSTADRLNVMPHTRIKIVSLISIVDFIVLNCSY